MKKKGLCVLMMSVALASVLATGCGADDGNAISGTVNSSDSDKQSGTAESAAQDNTASGNASQGTDAPEATQTPDIAQNVDVKAIFREALKNTSNNFKANMVREGRYTMVMEGSTNINLTMVYNVDVESNDKCNSYDGKISVDAGGNKYKITSKMYADKLSGGKKLYYIYNVDSKKWEKSYTEDDGFSFDLKDCNSEDYIDKIKLASVTDDTYVVYAQITPEDIRKGTVGVCFLPEADMATFSDSELGSLKSNVKTAFIIDRDTKTIKYVKTDASNFYQEVVDIVAKKDSSLDYKVSNTTFTTEVTFKEFDTSTVTIPADVVKNAVNK